MESTGTTIEDVEQMEDMETLRQSSGTAMDTLRQSPGTAMEFTPLSLEGAFYRHVTVKRHNQEKHRLRYPVAIQTLVRRL